MNVFFSLCSILIKAFYGITRGKLEKSAKGILKTVGIAALIIYGLASIAVIFISINVANYNALKPFNLQWQIVLDNVFLISIISFVFSLITTLSVYFLSEAEQSFQALPLKPWQIFTSKVVVVYISEALLSLLIMVPMMVIFGIKEQPPFLFYVYGTLGAFLVPVIPICLVFFIIVPVLRVFRFLRKRNSMLIVAGILGFSAMIAFQVYYQTNVLKMSDPAYVAANISSSESFLTKLGGIYPISNFVWKALAESASPEGFANFLALLGLASAVLLLTVFALSKPYAVSLIGFNEHKLKKLVYADKYIQDNFKQGGLFGALLKREFNLINREPVYFFNGPFIIILLPLVFVIMYVFQKPLLEKQFGGSLDSFISGIRNTSLSVLLPAAIGGFLGSGTLISATGFSRDAKFLPLIKSLPISPGKYGLVKLSHGLLFGLLAIVVTTIPAIIMLKLSFLHALLALGLAASYIWFTNIAGLYLDTTAPRLRWDTPTAAFKQNPNALAAIFASMGLVVLIGLAAYYFKISVTGCVLFLFLPMTVIAVFLTWRYPGFASKKMKSLEL